MPSTTRNISDAHGRTRWRPDPAQRLVLEAVFMVSNMPSRLTVDALAQSLKIDRRQARIWFQNKRQRVRKLHGASAVPNCTLEGPAATILPTLLMMQARHHALNAELPGMALIFPPHLPQLDWAPSSEPAPTESQTMSLPQPEASMHMASVSPPLQSIGPPIVPAPHPPVISSLVADVPPFDGVLGREIVSSMVSAVVPPLPSPRPDNSRAEPYAGYPMASSRAGNLSSEEAPHYLQSSSHFIIGPELSNALSSTPPLFLPSEDVTPAPSPPCPADNLAPSSHSLLELMLSPALVTDDAMNISMNDFCNGVLGP